MTQLPSPSTSSRILELDALRGIAAAAVLFCHLPRGFWFGETGVDLFFVLSGFLITTIILRSLDQPEFLRTFYWRRSLRILEWWFFSFACQFITITPILFPVCCGQETIKNYYAYSINQCRYSSFQR